MAKIKDYYDILGIAKDSSAEEIKKSYRRLARKHHPDLNPGDKAAEERFKEINEAYAVLGDPEKRKQYDAGGSAFLDGFEFEWPRGGAGTPFGESFDFGGLGDIFSDIFSTGRRAGPEVYRGADLIAAIDVSMDEAFTGVSRTMTISREVNCATCRGSGARSTETCQECGGKGMLQSARGFMRTAQACPGCGGTGRRVKESCGSCAGRGRVLKTETITLKIPAGVDTGSTVMLRGKGNEGVGGGPAGDLRLRVTVGRHPVFERRGDDIHLKLPVTFGEAALGAKIEVPTIDGSAKMTVPPGTQGGQRFKLTGKGFATRKGGRGNMFVDVAIAVPKEVSDDAREAIGKLSAAYGEDPRKGIKR